MEEILKAFAAEGLKVSLFHFTESYMKPHIWHLDLSMEEGIKFQLNCAAKTLEEVVEQASSRWAALRDRGIYAAMALAPKEEPLALESLPSDENSF